ncbi:MAG TPA: glycine cleavage T C-terminal barrel domain-containing protein, partial [Thermosynergistes sp.]|nr:glycine cleavage T C-terminal barrel domain-containing protein [Thermosynergistes sp.]
DISDRYAQLALQGPNSLEILQRLTPQPLNGIGFYRFKSNVSIGSASALLSRTGYTGEDGFEIYLDAAEAPTLWQRLLDAGSSLGLVPAGLGARDTLRFEACLPLYGNELSEKVTPLEAGLDRFVKFNKDFIGKEALWAQKEGGVRRRIAGLELLDPGVPRQGYEVRADGKAVGVVTSGSFAPYLKKYLALALLNSDFSREGQKLLVSIRGKEHRATVVPTPFYRRSGKV